MKDDVKILTGENGISEIINEDITDENLTEEMSAEFSNGKGEE